MAIHRIADSGAVMLRDEISGDPCRKENMPHLGPQSITLSYFSTESGA